MNSNYGKPNKANSFDFDLGLGTSQKNSLNDQKNNNFQKNNNNNNNNNNNSAYQPKPSYTHKPAPGLPTGPVSMVGDIFGKTWGTNSANIGVVNKNPNLFGDLVGSALGQKSSKNVPLKNVGNGNLNVFSTGGMADSLPKTGENVSNFAKSYNLGGASDNSAKSYDLGGGYGVGSNNFVKSTNLGGQPMKNMGGNVGGNSDPFASLAGFGTKNGNGGKVEPKNDPFGSFQDGTKTSVAEGKGDFFGSGSGMDDFAIPKGQNPNQPPVVQSSGDNVDVFGSFFTSSVPEKGTGRFDSNDQFSGGDDWGTDSNDNGGGTTELEGLPSPPAGVSASAAKNKGMDSYKQGQYADAIKWLSWAVILLEKSGDDVSRMEVLSCRASCYKEVGEYKKAVADCTKVLEHDEKSVSVLVQRALLYESMEKYRLGADDLRTVMKLDPMNRLARSTIHRLNKMAGSLKRPEVLSQRNQFFGFRHQKADLSPKNVQTGMV